MTRPPTSSRLLRTCVRLLAGCLGLAAVLPSLAETNLPLGMPIVTTHSPREYDAPRRNHALAINSRGTVYVANAKGLLEFDGEVWRKVGEGLFDEVFSVAVDGDDQIYIGTFDRFGRLEIGADGTCSFESLSQFIPEEHQGDQIFRRIIPLGDRVCFSSLKAAYIWTPSEQRMEVVPGLDNTSVVFALGSDIYSTSSTVPMRKLENGEWTPVPGTEVFEPDYAKILDVGVSKGGIAFLATKWAGVYRFDGETIRLYSRDPEFMERERETQSVLALSSGSVAVGTKRFGVFVFDETGKLLQRIDKLSGLSDDWADTMVEDGQRGVWIAQGNGLTRAQLGGEVTCYGPQHGLVGSVEYIEQFEGKLYVGTSLGLYVGERTDGEPRFRPVPEVPECKSLLVVPGGMLAGTITGLYLVNDGVATLIIPGLDSSYLMESKAHPGAVVAAGYPGLSVLRRSESGQWRQVGNGPVVEKPVHGMVEDANGDLWLKSGSGVTRRVRWFDGDRFSVETYGVQDGLAKDWVSPLGVNDTILFTSPARELYAFDEETKRFAIVKDHKYFPGDEVSGFIEYVRDANGAEWVARSVGQCRLIPKPSGDFVFGLQYLGSSLDVYASAIHVEPSGRSWFGSYDGLVRVEPRLGGPLRPDFRTFIRRVDSTDTGRVFWAEDATTEKSDRIQIEASRSMRVQASSDWGLAPEGMLYRFFLEGHDREPSAPSRESERHFTNLRPGFYRLDVQAFDSMGRSGSVASLGVLVHAPFYRNGWAYFGYAVCLIGAVAVVLYKMRTQSLNRVNQQLRGLVALRTDELAKQSQALEERNLQLEMRNAELRELAVKASGAAEAKTRFLAMMSHEIRTPMNGVMGMCALLGRTDLSREQAEYVDSIKTSSDSLLAIIDDILNYTRIEDGKLELEAIDFDLLDCAESVLTLVGRQAVDKGLELCLRVDPRLQRSRIGDPTRLRQVLVNLVGNAIKFTEAGAVTVEISPLHLEGAEWVRIVVSDTGVGVESSKHKSIFEPFFQADVSNVRRFGGTGLGLSICKHIVDCMGGTIELTSEQGKGARFTVLAPCPIREGSASLWEDREELAGKQVALFCVEDATRSLVNSYLEDWGVSVANCDVASLFLAGSPAVGVVDLAIIEHKLLSCDGADLAQRFLALEEEGFSSPVLLLVSRNTDLIRAEVGALQSVTTLSKPIVPSRLYQDIKGALRSGSVNDAHVETGLDGGRSGRFQVSEMFNDVRVLVAEDNRLNQDVVVRLLRGVGCDVTLAVDGQEAVRMYFQDEYDLVFMDVQMPELDGIEATRMLFELSSPGQEPFVYGLSAGVLREERQKCAEAGMVGFIRKPFEMMDLVAALKAARERRVARSGA